MTDSLSGGESDDQRDVREDGSGVSGREDRPDVGRNDAPVVDRRAKDGGKELSGGTGKGRENVLVSGVLKALGDGTGVAPGTVQRFRQKTGAGQRIAYYGPRTEGRSTLEDDIVEELATWKSKLNLNK